ncbi:uncharacterized protein LOC117174116 [Belonocnema kinseyi]|uniref:uncharacterized protein LOC117174116 n=1 Tax=Belonocnema kinseyi TaxID=2817044 RepID=UPI00143E0412|nr:uncharacterized protein LOC117174116 [Belonocnema kinseyi]
MPPKDTKTKKQNICCVVNCQSNFTNVLPGTQFYRFPLAKYKLPRREKWITAVRKQNPDASSWQPNENTRICSQHFVGNKKSEHPLSPSYNPTIFSDDNNRCTIAEEMATARFERNLKRRASSELIRSSKKCPAESLQSEEIAEVPIPQEISEQTVQPSVQIIQDNVEISHLQKTDQSVQVHFPEEDETDCKIFVCIKYNNMITCDAETQAFIPPNAENCNKERRKYCESDFLEEYKPDNTQSSEVENTRIFKCTAEFGEMSSISDFR